MEDKSTHMKFMRDNSGLILGMVMVSDTQINMSMKDNLIKIFYMEQESGEMETFIKEPFLIIRCRLYHKLNTEEIHNFLMHTIICFTEISCS